MTPGDVLDVIGLVIGIASAIGIVVSVVGIIAYLVAIAIAGGITLELETAVLPYVITFLASFSVFCFVVNES